MKTDSIEVKITLAQLHQLLARIDDLEFMVDKLNKELKKNKT